MKIKRKPVMASSRRAVKASSGRGKNPVLTVPASQCEALGLGDYPNFSSSGSVSGMRKKYYGDAALLIKCGGYIYNVSGNPDLYWAVYNGEIGASTRTRKTPIKADAADAGESEEIYYDVCINDNHNGSYYEREEDAIEVANEYAADPAYADDEITVVLEHYMTNARGEIIDYFDDNGAVVWNSNDAIYESTQIKSTSTRSRKRSIKAAAYGHNPWEQIELSKPDIIAQWQSESEGEPDTSWDNIFENALEDFKLYADDEASGNILDEFIEGDFDEIDMYNEFEQFMMWKDLADYDQ